MAPRILFLSSDWPHGGTFGGQIRALHLARALKQVGNVTLAIVGSEAGNEEALHRAREEYTVLEPIVPQISPNRGAVEKLKWALDPEYLNVHGYAASAADRERVLSEFSNYDLVWLLHSRTPNIMQIRDWPHSNLDMSDVPSTYLRSVSQNASGLTERCKAFAQKVILRRREALLTKRFTTISVCSEGDQAYLGGGEQIHVIPNGYERPAVDPVRSPATDPPRIGFIGLYSYAPNLDGVRWFLRECWPAIQRAVPGIRFRLLGKETDGPLTPTEDGVDVLGWVDDPAPEIATWSAMVIPIRFGGGTRVKIADSFSRKCPVVSTRLGAFGYEVEHGRELLLADDNDSKAFAAQCISLIQNPASAKEMAEQAYRTFLERWTWDAIAPRVLATAEDCMRRSRDQKSGSKDG